MTDARFPDRWLTDRRFARLSDSAFRSYITSLAWSVSNRTNGVIEPEDLVLIPNLAKNAVKEIIGAELWEPRQNAGRGWQISDYAATQTSSEQLAAAEAARVREREKKARQRAAKRAASHSVPPDVPGDVPRDNTGQDRQGKDRQGEGEVLRLAAGAEQQWRGTGPNPFDYND